MEHVLITGGTGTVGRHLAIFLAEKGYQITVLTRRLDQRRSKDARISYAYWNPEKKEIDADAFRSADHIIHLAGAGVVDQRWSAAYKKTILDSRVQGGACILHNIAHQPNQLQTLLSASAIGWYGPDQTGGHAFTETDPAYGDFLGQTCFAWENSTQTTQVRVCHVRIGIVLARHGGALPEFEKPLRFGLAAIPGSGRQIVSWIHIDDLCRIFLHLLTHKKLTGPFNAVAPHPVSSSELTKSIGRIRNHNRFIPIHIPAFFLKWIMGESSIEILKSTTVGSEKIQSTGFSFAYPEINTALTDLYSRKKQS